jgi:TatD DNase family protein
MRPKLFDIHSHLNFPDFDRDREEVIERMKQAGVFTVVVGTDKKTSKTAIELAEQNEGIFASVGLHPTDKQNEPFDFDYYKNLAQHPKVVAIGECGLDYYRSQEARNPKSEIRNKQKDIFKKHIELAIESGKPLMIHCRGAHDEVIEILSGFHSQFSARQNGNIHFFSGTWQEAQRYFNLGFTISFAGVITFSRDYDEVIRNTPFEKLLIETDAPFVSPVPYRGRRNEPAYVAEAAKQIAKIRNISYEEVAETTTQNALKLFKIIKVKLR